MEGIHKWKQAPNSAQPVMELDPSMATLTPSLLLLVWLKNTQIGRTYLNSILSQTNPGDPANTNDFARIPQQSFCSMGFI